MKNVEKLFVLVCLATSFSGFSQKTTDVAGGVGIGAGGNISYSVGQIVYTTSSGTNGTLTQGVQQSYQITTVSGIEEAKRIELVYSAYPNPTADILILKVENYNNQNLLYQLVDINGRVLGSQKINENETSILMNSFSSGTYFLKIIQDQKEVRIFKIIKN